VARNTEVRYASELEARLRRFDGDIAGFLHRAEPLRDELGNIVKMVRVVYRLEDRKRAEVALREANSAFRLCRNGIRLVLGDGRATGSPAYRTPQRCWHPAPAPNWRGSLGYRN